MSDTYNGWTNRETWAAHLWLTNDPDVYRWARGQSADSLKGAFETASNAGDFYSAEFGTFSDNIPGWHGHALRDIGSLWRVDWNEVAAALSQ